MGTGTGTGVSYENVDLKASPNNRYEKLDFVREHNMYRDTYVVYESDPEKGLRITQLTSEGVIIRED